MLSFFLGISYRNFNSTHLPSFHLPRLTLVVFLVSPFAEAARAAKRNDNGNKVLDPIYCQQNHHLKYLNLINNNAQRNQSFGILHYSESLAHLRNNPNVPAYW